MIYQPSPWPSPTHGRGNTLSEVTDNHHVSGPLTVAAIKHILTLMQDLNETGGTAVNVLPVNHRAIRRSAATPAALLGHLRHLLPALL